MKFSSLCLFFVASLIVVLSNSVNAADPYQYFVFDQQNRCNATRTMEINQCLAVTGTPSCTGSLKVNYLPASGEYSFNIYPNMNCGNNPVAISNFSCSAGSTPTSFQGFIVSCFNPTFKYFVINQKQCNVGNKSLEVDTCLAVNGTSSDCTGSLEVSFVPTASSNEFTFNTHTNNNCSGSAALSNNFTCSTNGVYTSYPGYDIACFNEKQIIASSSDDGSENSSSFISVSILLLVFSCLLSII